jgi:NDP-sugar pyrophosphorylase family protein
MQAVILAGGKGTRLGAAIPKPLVTIGEVPVLHHILRWLREEGVTRALLCTGFRAELIEASVGDGAAFGIDVAHRPESTPLGTAGALRARLAELPSTFLVVYADVMPALSLGPMRAVHRRSGAAVTLAAHPNDHPFDSDRLETDETGRIARVIRPADRVGPEGGNLCSAALYLMEREVVGRIPEDGAVRDLARDVFPDWIAAGLHLQAWRTAGYLKDMGTPHRRAQVEADHRAGLRPPGPRPGVVVTGTPDELCAPDAVAALARLRAAKVLLGWCPDGLSHAEVRATEGRLGALHVFFDAIGAPAEVVDALGLPPDTSPRRVAALLSQGLDPT